MLAAAAAEDDGDARFARPTRSGGGNRACGLLARHGALRHAPNATASRRGRLRRRAPVSGARNVIRAPPWGATESEPPAPGPEQAEEVDADDAVLLGDIGDLLILVDCARAPAGLLGHND